jgi:Rieske Fe-S protein
MAPQEHSNQPGRRAFLLLVPFGVIGGILVSVLSAAFKFLRPSGSSSSVTWLNVVPLSEIKGDKPVPHTVISEQSAGWAITKEEHRVYVLPVKNNQVLSAVCPHEGCEVAWEEQNQVFACPCHESSFAADGSKIDGPARRGLDPLPARVENGTLQIQYKSFVNNSEERITRG